MVLASSTIKVSVCFNSSQNLEICVRASDAPLHHNIRTCIRRCVCGRLCVIEMLRATGAARAMVAREGRGQIDGVVLGRGGDVGYSQQDSITVA